MPRKRRRSPLKVSRTVVSDVAVVAKILPDHQEGEALAFPFLVPGYGRIENRRAWVLFCREFQETIDAFSRAKDSLEALEAENEHLRAMLFDDGVSREDGP